MTDCQVTQTYSVRDIALRSAVSERLLEIAYEEEACVHAVAVAAWTALAARYAGRAEDGDPDARELIRRAARSLAGRELTHVHAFRHFVPAMGDDVDVTVRLEGASDGASTDLEIRVELDTAPWRLELHARTGRVTEDAAARVAGHLRAMLEGMADDAGPVSAVPIVRGEERAWILAQSRAMEVDFDEQLPTVVELFEAHVARAPQSVALVDGDRELTYAQLDAAANAICHRVRALSLEGNARVAVYLERSADAVIAFVGILKARATYVPIDTGYPAGRVAAILACAEPRAIITRAALSAALPEPTESAKSPTIVLMDRQSAPVRSDERPAARPRVRPDDVAYTIFTSGSTGKPKGVVVEHRSLANYARAAEDAYGVSATDRVLQAASLGFDLSLEEIVVTLCAGAALVVRSAPPIESVQSFLAECTRRDLTVLSITSALWHELTMRLADGSVTLPARIRLVILGADVARPDVLALWQRATGSRIRLVNSYGLTETTIVATVWEATSELLDDGWRAVPIGRPLRNVSAYVVDANREIVPVGVAGEVCIGGLAVANRYLADDTLTNAKFVPDPFLPGRRMYATGDRGILRANGDLEFLGRTDYQIKVNGVRIELGEIETRLRELAGVVEGIVVARKSSAGETELEAYVMASSTDVTTTRLREHLSRLIPLQAVPSRMTVVDRFPLTPAGKIDRRALTAHAEERDRADFVAPRSLLEELVVTVTAEVLGLARVGMHDGFVTLGGSSLSAVRVASLLGHRLGRRVRAQVFLQSKTLRDACAELEAPETERSPIALLERDAVLDPAIVPAAATRTQGRMSNVLLTGATGFYGTFVLADLLERTHVHVVCLVRARSDAAARARLLGSLEERRCAIDAVTLTSRLTVLAGDIDAPHFGLEDATFARLTDTVDTVIHSAARVNVMLPYEALRASNVVAVATILEFATTGMAKTVHHVSTVEVLSDMSPAEPGARTERRIAASPTLFREGYGQSKWVAEKLVVEARARGVRAFIHRPGRLMGHSRTGAFNHDDFLVRMLDACAQVGAVPALDVTVDFTPVDYASGALVHLATRDNELGDDHEAFHLVHPDDVSWASLVGIIAGLGYPLRVVPHAEWCQILERRAPSSDRGDFLLYLAEMSREETEASIHGGYASDRTRAALGGEVDCPPIDAQLLAVHTRVLAAEGRFPMHITPRTTLAPARRHSVAPLPRAAESVHGRA